MHHLYWKSLKIMWQLLNNEKGRYQTITINAHHNYCCCHGATQWQKHLQCCQANKDVTQDAGWGPQEVLSSHTFWEEMCFGHTHTQSIHIHLPMHVITVVGQSDSVHRDLARPNFPNTTGITPLTVNANTHTIPDAHTQSVELMTSEWNRKRDAVRTEWTGVQIFLLSMQSAAWVCSIIGYVTRNTAIVSTLTNMLSMISPPIISSGHCGCDVIIESVSAVTVEKPWLYSAKLCPFVHFNGTEELWQTVTCWTETNTCTIWSKFNNQQARLAKLTNCLLAVAYHLLYRYENDIKHLIKGLVHMFTDIFGNKFLKKPTGNKMQKTIALYSPICCLLLPCSKLTDDDTFAPIHSCN